MKKIIFLSLPFFCYIALPIFSLAIGEKYINKMFFFF